MTDIQHKKLYRSPKEGMLAGIVAGIAHYFEVDAVFVRLVWLAVSFVTHLWPTLVLYVILAFIIPVDPSQDTVPQHQAPKDVTDEQH